MCEVNQDALELVLGLVVIVLGGALASVGFEIAWDALRAYWRRRNGR
ncbi:TPA: hypothetical protein ACKQCJ_000204 [Stenotrophomonas maltophilia]